MEHQVTNRASAGVRCALAALLAVTTARAVGEPLAFVTNQGDNSVSVIDTELGQVIHVTPVGEYPEGILVAPDGRRVYVANWFSDELLILNAREFEVIGRIPTGNGPRAFGIFIASGT